MLSISRHLLVSQQEQQTIVERFDISCPDLSSLALRRLTDYEVLLWVSWLLDRDCVQHAMDLGQNPGNAGGSMVMSLHVILSPPSL